MIQETEATEMTETTPGKFSKPHAYIAIRWGFDLTDPNNVWLQLTDEERVDVTDQLTKIVTEVIGSATLAKWYDIEPPPTDEHGHMTFAEMMTFLTDALAEAGLNTIIIPNPLPEDDYEITDARRRCKHYFALAKDGVPWVEVIRPGDGEDLAVTATMQIELSWDTKIEL